MERGSHLMVYIIFDNGRIFFIKKSKLSFSEIVKKKLSAESWEPELASGWDFFGIFGIFYFGLDRKIPTIPKSRGSGFIFSLGIFIHGIRDFLSLWIFLSLGIFSSLTIFTPGFSQNSRDSGFFYLRDIPVIFEPRIGIFYLRDIPVIFEPWIGIFFAGWDLPTKSQLCWDPIKSI